MTTANKQGKLGPLFYSKSHNWQTPPDLFNALNSVFNFELDPCTTIDNPLGTRFLLTERQNALTANWYFDAFVNPPFNMVKPFTEKCMHESARNKITVVEIMANRTETDAVQLYAPFAEAIVLINKRVSFIDPETQTQQRAPTFGSMLLIFRPEPLTGPQLELLKSMGLVLCNYNKK